MGELPEYTQHKKRRAPKYRSPALLLELGDNVQTTIPASIP